ncbi:MAG: hypothetical protein ACXWKG_12785 [Limisphaerales bacterium]
MNSREKGKRGEREWRDELRANGYEARRGQQFSGSVDSPDVVCPVLAWLHFEVKRVQNLNLTDACVQAIGDCAGKPWVVAHRRNNAPWLITMSAETFFKFLRGELPLDGTALRAEQKQTNNPPTPKATEDRQNKNETESKTYESSPTVSS